jgi:hypothetical protein
MPSSCAWEKSIPVTVVRTVSSIPMSARSASITTIPIEASSDTTKIPIALGNLKKGN